MLTISKITAESINAPLYEKCEWKLILPVNFTGCWTMANMRESINIVECYIQ